MIQVKSARLPDRLKELRLAHSCKQVEIASALGVVRQTYSNYENGSRTPGSEILYKIAAFYNISVNELLQNTVDLDPEIYYDSPTPSETGLGLNTSLEYLKVPENQTRLTGLTNKEKELVFYFDQLNNSDKWELLEIAKILIKKKESPT